VESFFRGAVIGFAVAAPVGPIALLCLRRTLRDGVALGLASGLGVACADACYAAVVVLAFGAATAFVARFAGPMHVVAGVVLVILGVRMLLAAPPAAGADGPRVRRLAGASASTFALTIVNPATIVSFAALVAGTQAGAPRGGVMSGVALVAGVASGSAVWWCVWCGTAGVLRRRVSERAILVVNRASALVLALFGVASLVVALRA
jgi:threonine/homoserine/homoserine lactone efflux protein